jgi:hypothetical protein
MTPPVTGGRATTRRPRCFAGQTSARTSPGRGAVATWFGYFWPGWALAGCTALVLLDAWEVYVRRPITEDDIDREMRNQRQA